MVRQEQNTVSVKDLHFLQGESPCQVRLSKPTCIECCVTLGGIKMTDDLLIKSIKQTFDFQPNDSYEAYTENCIDRKGNRTSLKQFSLVTAIKAVGQGVILSKTETKEPFCKVLEELPGSKSVVCAERNVGNLGDPFGSCIARKELPTIRRHSGYLRGVRSFHSTLRRESRPHGEGNDVITQPAQEKWSRQGELEITMQTSRQGIATGHQMSPFYLTEVF